MGNNSGSKYLILLLDDEKKGNIKKYEETLNKIKYLIELENNDSSKFDVK